MSNETAEKRLEFVTEVKDATDFVEIDPNESRYELYIDFEEKTASVGWVHQSSYNSMGMAEYNGCGRSFILPALVNAFAVKAFIEEELDATAIFEGFETEWDGSNWKGVWSDELSELIEGIDTSQIDELELSDWSENDFDNTEDFITCEGHEITAETTDEQLEEIQESIESQRGDVYYSGVLQAITEYRDHLVERGEQSNND